MSRDYHVGTQHAAHWQSPMSLKNDFIILMCPYDAFEGIREGENSSSVTITGHQQFGEIVHLVTDVEPSGT